MKYTLYYEEIVLLISNKKKEIKELLGNLLPFSTNDNLENDKKILYSKLIGGINSGFFGSNECELKSKLKIKSLNEKMDIYLNYNYYMMLDELKKCLEKNIYIFENKNDISHAFEIGYTIGDCKKNEFKKNKEYNKEGLTPLNYLKNIKESNKEKNKSITIDMSAKNLEYEMSYNFYSITDPKYGTKNDDKEDLLCKTRKSLNKITSKKFSSEHYAGPIISEMFKGFYGITSKDLTKYIKQDLGVKFNEKLYDVLPTEQKDMLIVMHKSLLNSLENVKFNDIECAKKIAEEIGQIAREIYVDDPKIEIANNVYIDNFGKKKIKRK